MVVLNGMLWLLAMFTPAAALISPNYPHVKTWPEDRKSVELGEFVGENQQPMWGSTKPWAHRTCHSHPDDIPDTGVTRYYDFWVSYGNFTPDGVMKEMMVVNGQYPGPTIEANWGDWFEVTVYNELNEGTSMHWHGMLQQGTPWADGVPGVTQCPIAPGEKLTYRFRASTYGTSWYHSHYSSQYSMGISGPMVIHGPKHYEYDTDLGPVLLTDWSHRDYHEVLKHIFVTDPSQAIPWVFSDSVLINGKNNQLPCEECAPYSGLSRFNFKEGRKHLLRFINGGSAGTIYITIDQHDFQVVALDFEPIKPYKTSILSIAVGQRMDVLVIGTGKSDSAYNMWARNEVAQGCDEDLDFPFPAHTARAIIYYESTPASAAPEPSSAAAGVDACGERPVDTIVPYRVEAVNDEDVRTVNMEITVHPNKTGIFLFFENESSFVANLSHPVLRDVASRQEQFPKTYNLLATGGAQRVRFVIINKSGIAHPMHMHGHVFQILAHTPSLSWDGTIAKPENPLRRDTQIVDVNSTLVLQIEAANPGVWMLHCHTSTHMSVGLVTQFIELREEILGLKSDIETEIEKSCKAWDAWTRDHEVGQVLYGARTLVVKDDPTLTPS